MANRFDDSDDERSLSERISDLRRGTKRSSDTVVGTPKSTLLRSPIKRPTVPDALKVLEEASKAIRAKGSVARGKIEEAMGILRLLRLSPTKTPINLDDTIISDDADLLATLSAEREAHMSEIRNLVGQVSDMKRILSDNKKFVGEIAALTRQVAEMKKSETAAPTSALRAKPPRDAPTQPPPTTAPTAVGDSDVGTSGGKWTEVRRRNRRPTSRKPALATKHLVVVHPKASDGNSQATRSDFKRQLRDKTSDLDIVGMRLASNKSIIVESKNVAAKEKLIAAFNSDNVLAKDYTIAESRKKLPTVIVRNVEQSGRRDKAKFAAEIIAGNPTISDAVGASVGTSAVGDSVGRNAVGTSDIDLLFERRARSGKQHLRDLVLRVSPKVRVAMIAVGELKIGFGAARVEDYTHVTQCFKCLGFGHQSDRCVKTPKCSHCAGDHDFRQCPDKEASDKKCCHNCAEANARRSPTSEPSVGAPTGIGASERRNNRRSFPTSHAATSRSCPQYASLVTLIQQRTDYGC
jgi:hypothetical protein